MGAIGGISKAKMDFTDLPAEEMCVAPQVQREQLMFNVVGSNPVSPCN
jgi:hypothetical protein